MGSRPAADGFGRPYGPRRGSWTSTGMSGLITRIPAPRPMASDSATQVAAWGGLYVGTVNRHVPVRGSQIRTVQSSSALASSSLPAMVTGHTPLTPAGALLCAVRCWPVRGPRSAPCRPRRRWPAAAAGHGERAHAFDPTPVAIERGALLAGAGVPDPDRAVPAGAGQHLLPGHHNRAHARGDRRCCAPWPRPRSEDGAVAPCADHPLPAILRNWERSRRRPREGHGSQPAVRPARLRRGEA
jgi:hypothetical protein